MTFYFCIPLPYDRKDIFFGGVLEGLVGLHRTIQLQLILGKIKGRRRRGQQRMRWLDGLLTQSTDMSLSRLQDMVKDREAWHAAVHGVTKSWTRLSD